MLNPYAKQPLANPFSTFSNFVWPRTVKGILDWAEWLWDRNDIYRKGIQCTVRYHINDIAIVQRNDVSKTNSDVIEQYRRCLVDGYDILNLIRRIGENQAAMGICVVTALRKIQRALVCPHCGTMMLLHNLDKGNGSVGTYKFHNLKFTSTCPNPGCNYKGEFDREDMPDTSEQNIVFKIWPQRDLRILRNAITGRCQYYYEIPQEIKTAILEGDPLYLEDTDWNFIVAASSDATTIRLKDESTLCLVNDTIASLEKFYNGWGPPMFLASFPRILQLQMLDRFNQALAMDYINPIRMISPPAGALQAGNDPQRMPISGAMLRHTLNSVISGSRTNPTQWITSPIPLQYQLIGGEAKQLSPVDLIEWETAQLLSGMNIPMEFRQTTFQVAAPTMGLHMFERTTIHFSHGLDKAANWIGEQVARAQNWEPVTVSIEKTSYVEDEGNKQVLLQMVGNQVVSKETGLRPFGIDARKEFRKLLDEQTREQEAYQKLQEKQNNQGALGQVMAIPPPGAIQAMGDLQNSIAMQQQAGQPQQPAQPGMPAGPMGGGAPMPAGGGAPSGGDATPSELTARAQEIAQQLYAAPDRASQLIQMSKSDPTLHAVVKSMLEQMERQTGSQAVMASKQPNGGM